MGGREVGYLSHQLPGYRVVTNDMHRAYLEGAWRVPPGSIDSKPGLTAVPMFEAAAEGKVRALWIACTNPAVSMPDTRGITRRTAACGLGHRAGLLLPDGDRGIRRRAAPRGTVG